MRKEIETIAQVEQKRGRVSGLINRLRRKLGLFDQVRLRQSQLAQMSGMEAEDSLTEDDSPGRQNVEPVLFKSNEIATSEEIFRLYSWEKVRGEKWDLLSSVDRSTIDRFPSTEVEAGSVELLETNIQGGAEDTNFERIRKRGPRSTGHYYRGSRTYVKHSDLQREIIDNIDHQDNRITQTELKAILQEFVTRQKIELSGQKLEQLEQFRSGVAQEIFRAFRSSKSYQDILRFVKYEFATAQTEEQSIRRRQLLSGRVHQDLAQRIMEAEEYPRIILPCGPTLEIFEKLHPGFRKTREMFGLDSIMGISVPDGLIVEEGIGRAIISGFVESKAQSYDHPEYEEKYTIYKEAISRLSSEYPSVFRRNSEIVFVIPSSAGEAILPAVGRQETARLKVLKYDFIDLRQFVNGIIPRAVKDRYTIFSK